MKSKLLKEQNEIIQYYQRVNRNIEKLQQYNYNTSKLNESYEQKLSDFDLRYARNHVESPGYYTGQPRSQLAASHN